MRGRRSRAGQAREGRDVGWVQGTLAGWPKVGSRRSAFVAASDKGPTQFLTTAHCSILRNSAKTPALSTEGMGQ